MAQYIPLDAVVAEIENRIKKYTLLQQKPEMSDLQEVLQNKIDCLNSIKGYILNTLEVKEVDFEKELDRIWFDNKLGDYFDNDALDFAHIRTLCRHFFELGLSVSNSTKVTIPDIDDVLKENGVNPDSKEAKIIKESYFMAIERLTQKGEEV